MIYLIVFNMYVFFKRIKGIKEPNEYMKKILIAFIGLFAGSHEIFPIDILKKHVDFSKNYEGFLNMVFL